MPVRDDLGTRMKEFYEQVPKFKLYRRTPVAIRIDGKAFHTFTRGFQKPFDEVLGNAMVRTMEYLCKNIQGCVFGYTQSDELTLILVDYQTLETDAWFDYEIQKLCSVSASMATMAFNKFFNEEVLSYILQNDTRISTGYPKMLALTERQDTLSEYEKILLKSAEKGAMFDARCFNIPKEEVTNLVYWRQLDATRNSIQMVGQANFSHSELQNKSCNDIQDMLHEQKGINWNDFPTRWKRGVCCRRVKDFDEYGNDWGGWVIDYEMPILKGEDRAYIDNLIFVGE
jgi:tRNA(His) 5'-end guanylyltransferase